MDDGSAASIVLFVVLLLIDMFFYGFGAAIIALNEKEVERKADEEKDKRSVKLKKIIGNPAEYVNTVQLITTLINVIIGATHLGILLRAIRNGLVFLVEKQLGLKAVTVQVFLVTAAVLSTLLI
ncbi:MAG: CNNM domain-containing protein, partial [Acetatifactor sp.]|nr:CNNM domain-containing protein [Acetatifactor sp.]